VDAPNPLKRLLDAGVLAVVCALELAAPNVKGVAAGAGVLEGAAVPNMLVEGAALLVPKRPPDAVAVVVLFCASPPKGLLGGCEVNIEPLPKAAGVLPFIDAPLGALAKGFPPVAAVKLKPFADGGWGLKPALCEFAPNAGNDELLKVLLGAADCAGGKLLVAPPPKALLPPPNMPPFVLLLPPTAGADDPKPKPVCCGVLKLALCDGVCARALASCSSCLRRISRRPAALL
jgi:hypothetical protein